MRVTMLTTVAAAALSLSVAAMAQTGGTSSGSMGGASGGTSAGAAGSSSGSTMGTGGSGSSAPSVRPEGGSGSMGGSQSAPDSTGSTAGSQSSSGSGATSGSSARGSGSAQEAPGATGSTSSSSTQVNVTTEQQTRLSETFRSVEVEPLTDVNFSVSVGSVIPATVTTLHECPSTVESILTGLPECRYVVVRDQIVIVEPSTRKIVTVIQRRG